jgi:hypothetical protein
MGVEIQEISGRNRAQLVELLAELAGGVG